jgi:hypothetical protein
MKRRAERGKTSDQNHKPKDKGDLAPRRQDAKESKAVIPLYAFLRDFAALRENWFCFFSRERGLE